MVAGRSHGASPGSGVPLLRIRNWHSLGTGFLPDGLEALNRNHIGPGALGAANRASDLPVFLFVEGVVAVKSAVRAGRLKVLVSPSEGERIRHGLPPRASAWGTAPSAARRTSSATCRTCPPRSARSSCAESPCSFPA